MEAANECGREAGENRSPDISDASDDEWGGGWLEEGRLELHCSDHENKYSNGVEIKVLKVDVR